MDDLDPHLALLRAELAEDVPRRCVRCGGPAEGNTYDADGEVCDARITADKAAWAALPELVRRIEGLEVGRGRAGIAGRGRAPPGGGKAQGTDLTRRKPTSRKRSEGSTLVRVTATSSGKLLA